MTRSVRTTAVVVSAAVLLVSLWPLRAAQATTSPGELDWQPSYREMGPAFECATAMAPLDYDRPDREAIELALIRLPAGHPDEKIGSIFINPGRRGGRRERVVSELGRRVPWRVLL